MRIADCGISFRKICPGAAGLPFNEVLRVKRPEVAEADFDTLAGSSEHMVILETRTTPVCTLRGQFERINEGNCIVFLGSPWYGSIEDLKAADLTMHDFAVHDPMIDLLHVLKTQEIANQEMKELLDTHHAGKLALKAAVDQVSEMALFPMQNPDPLIRFSTTGEILMQNPAAENLISFVYKGRPVTPEQLWQQVAGEANREDERYSFEALSDEKIYSFVCKFFPHRKYFNAYGRNITPQKKAEEQIGVLSLAAKANHNGIVFLDEQMKISWVNAAFEEMTGYTREELVGESPAELFFDAFADAEVLNTIQTAGRKKENLTIELAHRRKDGSYFRALMNSTAIPAAQRSAGAWRMVMIEDVTEKKKQQEEIERLSFVASLNENGVVFTNIDGKITWANDGYRNLTGYSQEEAIGKTPVELSRGALTDPAELQKMISAFFKGESFHVELVQYRKDGTWFWGRTHGQAIRDEQGNTTQYFATIEDISREKEQEESLRQNEAKYRGIISNMNLGLIEISLDDRILFANQSFFDMSGYTMEELQGSTVTNLFVTPDLREKVKEKKALRKQGISDAYELKVMHKDGTHRWWLISGAPSYNKEGKVTGSVGIHLDITAQKSLEADLIRSREQAEQLTRTKENFLANMSHEIRTPMNAIIGMSNQLGKSNLSDQQRFYLSTIRSAAENLLVIINDILDLSKIEAGKLSVESIGFAPRTVVGNAMEVLRHKAEEKGLELTNSFCDERLAPVLLGDPYRINQVLLNLMSNAIKFTEKGTVDIACEVLEDDDTHQRVRGTVKDTGIGMDKDFLDRLFEKFSQEEPSVTRRFGGTGLGMSICKQLVELMGGRIHVESEKGKGTKVSFELRLPKGDIEDIPVVKKVQIDQNFLQGKKILIADDNDINRLVAATLLKSHGAEIVEATNGKEAVLLQLRMMPDLILMDIQMPLMNGYEATDLIRKNKYTGPIIALTANAIKGENEKCLQTGMDRYISKPFREDAFLTVIAECLQIENQAPVITPDASSITRPETTVNTLYNVAYLQSTGDYTFAKKMTDIFGESMPEMAQQLRKAHTDKDFGALAAVAHKMKSGIDTLKIYPLLQPIRWLESAGEQKKDNPEIPQWITLVEEVIDSVVIDMQERIEKWKYENNAGTLPA